MSKKLEELVVADGEYDSAGTRCEAYGKEMQGYIKRFLNILREITSERCIVGYSALAVKEVRKTIEWTLNDVLPGLTAAQKKHLADFVASIDLADQLLY